MVNQYGNAKRKKYNPQHTAHEFIRGEVKRMDGEWSIKTEMQEEKYSP